MAPTSRKSGRPGQAMFILVALPMISYFLYANVLNEYQ